MSSDPDMCFIVSGFDEFAKPLEPSRDMTAATLMVKKAAKDKEGRRRKKKKAKIASMPPEELEEFEHEQNQRGIVYISRVPPYMKPEKLRHELSKYGTIMRIYLTPEDRMIHLKRKRFKGNSKKNYIDGWVEFARKDEAERVALLLNATAVGGRKRGYYYDDLWNLKYLPDFKWRHLTESVTQLKVEKKQKMQYELQQAKQERAFYLSKVSGLSLEPIDRLRAVMMPSMLAQVVQARGVRAKEQRLVRN